MPDRFTDEQRKRHRRLLEAVDEYMEGAVFELDRGEDENYQAKLQSLIGIARLALDDAHKVMNEFDLTELYHEFPEMFPSGKREKIKVQEMINRAFGAFYAEGPGADADRLRASILREAMLIFSLRTNGFGELEEVQ